MYVENFISNQTDVCHRDDDGTICRLFLCPIKRAAYIRTRRRVPYAKRTTVSVTKYLCATRGGDTILER